MTAIMRATAVLLGCAALGQAGDPGEPELKDAVRKGTALSQQGRYREAGLEYERAVRLAESAYGKADARTVPHLNDLARAYQRQGRHADAEALYQRALKIREDTAGANHRNVAAALNNLAGLRADQGQYADAEPLYRRALKILEDVAGADHPDVAAALHNLAGLYRDQGRLDEAEAHYRRSLRIVEAAQGAKHRNVATALNSLAGLYAAAGRYADAEPLYRRALKIREEWFGDDHPDTASVGNNLARVLVRFGRFADAEPLYRRSLRVWEDRLGGDHPNVAIALSNLARLHERQGRHADAEPLYRRALAIQEAKFGDGHPGLAATLNNLASLCAATGRWPEAAGHFERAQRDQRRHLRVNLAPLGPPQQLAFLARNVHPGYHLALSLAAARRDDAAMAARAAGWLLNGKGLTYEVLAEPLALARAGRDPGLREVAQELLGVRGRAAFLTLAAPAPGREKRRRAELDEALRRERELTEQLARSARVPAAAAWEELAGLRRALPADAVFLDFARYRVFDFARGDWSRAERYLACVVPPAGRGAVALFDLGPVAPVEEAVGAVCRALRDSPRATAARGEPTAEREAKAHLGRLADLVLKPLYREVEKFPRWVVGPDAALWLAPFEALPLPDGRYAVEGHSVRYVTSGRALLRAPPAGAGPGPALVLADPDFDGPTPAGGVAAAPPMNLAPAAKLPRFTRLPGTAWEAAAVAAALKRLTKREPVLRTGRGATEGVVKAAKGPRVLMLSTHGYFLPDQGTLPEAGQLSEIPLLRCGLALAGANQKGPRPDGAEDGILTGLEVLGCDLAGTELVVLSACETGLGQVNNGEGVAGLRQAFHLAGAKAVLASLWRVPDRPTADLMSAFFAELEKGGDHAQALRRAQLSMLRQRRELDGAAHPFFWAAFTLTTTGRE